MPSLILITGATGHLGFRTLVFLLQHGYRARITYRRPNQPDTIKKAASIQPFLDVIEFAYVPNITAPHAYDEAIKGTDGVLHIASPIHTGLGPEQTNWQELLYDPAEKGSLRMLEAALTEPKVKRIVMTSSVVVVEPKNGSNRAGPYDICPLPSPPTMQTVTDRQIAYCYSKIVSHITATNFMQNNQCHFDLIRVLPGLIQGAHELYTDAEQLSDHLKSGSNEGVMTTALGLKFDAPRTNAQVWLDDVAKAHVLALKPSVAKNGDVLSIVGNGGDSQPWSDYVPIIEKLFPEAVRNGRLNPGNHDADRLTYFDVESSEKALGFKFAGAEEMVKSVVGQYLELLKKEMM